LYKIAFRRKIYDYFCFVYKNGMSKTLTQPSSDLTASLPVITIDGSSGAGKGTLTARLAKLLDYQILDSGALYRIVGLAAHQAGLLTDSIDETALADLTQLLKIEFAAAKAGSEHVTVLVNANDVSEVIRTTLPCSGILSLEFGKVIATKV
jgi:CMP/dCMP kinase